MSENREQVFENEEFQVLLRKYEDMKSGTRSIFFDVEEEFDDHFVVRKKLGN